MAVKVVSACMAPNMFIKLQKNGLTFENNNNIVYKKLPQNNRGKNNSGGLNRVFACVAPWITIYVPALLASIFCYWNSAAGDFVHDDVLAIKTNADARSETPMWSVFVNDFWGKAMADNTSHKSYRPLTVLTFRLNHYLGGESAYGYHVLNILLHAVATVLVTWLCHGVVFLRGRPATLAGVLFAVHPIHTEAVSGIVGRADILACIFFLLSFMFYLRCIHHQSDTTSHGVTSWLPLVTSMTFAAAAMLFKEQGVTVLGVCLIYDVCVLNKPVLHRVLQHAGNYFSFYHSLSSRFLTVLFTIVLLLSLRVWIMSGQLPAFMDQDNPAAFSPHTLTRILTHSYLPSVNMWLLLCPWQLSYDWQMHSIPLIHTLSDPRNLATLAFMAGYVVIIFRCINAKKEEGSVLLLGLSMLTVPFLPASNLFFTVGFVLAERILYIPSIGFIILVVHGWDKLDRRFRHNHKVHKIFSAITVCVVALLASRTLIRNQVWQSRQSLFRSGVQTFPNNAKVHYNYANFLKDSGFNTLAAQHYRRTLRLWPSHASAHNNLATILKDPLEAEKHYRKAVAINPSHCGAHFNLGNLYLQQNKYREALVFLYQAVHIDPGYAEVYLSIASVMKHQGHTEGTRKNYQRYISMRPHDPNGFINLAGFLQHLGQLDEALETVQKVFDFAPDHQGALLQAARIYRSINKTSEAAEIYERLLKTSRDSTVLDSAGIFYFNIGQLNKASDLFMELLTKDPGHMDGAVHLAQTFMKQHRKSDAEKILLHVINRDKTHLEAHLQLAALYGALSKHRKAIHQLEEALCHIQDAESTATLHYQKANHHKDSNDLDLALQSYLNAVNLKPDILNAQLNIGVIYHIKHDFERAMHHYTRASVLDPDNALLKENMRKLEMTRKRQQMRNDT